MVGVSVCENVFGLVIELLVVLLSLVLTYRTDFRIAFHSIRSSFTSSCFLPCWQVIFDDLTTPPLPRTTKKKSAKIIRKAFFFLLAKFVLPFLFYNSYHQYLPFLSCRMSKSSTATAQKIPTQLPSRSAWARGPPQNTSPPTPRSQSPAPSSSSHPTHSRRPSTLGQGVPIKDGVSVPRGNVSAVKQGMCGCHRYSYHHPMF